MRNLLFVLSGPSGVGKGTIVRRLLAEEEGLVKSVSCTTRRPRPGEREGIDYFFLTEEEFTKRQEEGYFLETDRHFAHAYGTPAPYVQKQLEQHSVILEIDVVGGLTVREKTEAVLIFVDAPSEEVLFGRLLGRGSETEEQIASRRARVSYERGLRSEYDYVVVNDDLDRAVQEIAAIIHAEREK